MTEQDLDARAREIADNVVTGVIYNPETPNNNRIWAGAYLGAKAALAERPVVGDWVDELLGEPHSIRKPGGSSTNKYVPYGTAYRAVTTALAKRYGYDREAIAKLVDHALGVFGVPSATMEWSRPGGPSNLALLTADGILALLSPPSASVDARGEMVERFASALENADLYNAREALSMPICCNGKDCGCRGSSVGEYLAYELRTALNTDREG